ncbi:hypothetical protein ACKKBG_A21755 [Auxenochlorella protothecoides x Auxenochlorella symbiontica]
MGDPPGMENTEAGARLARLLYRKLKVFIDDGRVLVGELSCLDADGNIILAGAHEELIDEHDGTCTRQQPMGSILIPAAKRTSVLVEVGDVEAKPLAALLQL